MSTAATVDAAPAPRGKKKLILALIVLALLLAGGGGAFVLIAKSKAHAAEADADADDGHAAAARPTRVDTGKPPTFVPLDSFTVNLADRDADRYAQVGITLEVDDPKLAETIKVFMPAIRNRVLMAIADRTAAELLGREGKTQLAERVRRETSIALGHEVADDETPATADGDGDADAATPARKTRSRAKPRAAPALPVRAVHFSNFIVQ